MRLKELFPGSLPPGADANASVSRITQDSREAGPGVVFVAVRGTARDGHEFIPAVCAAGAMLVVGEEPVAKHAGAPYLQVEDSRRELARLASRFHGEPWKKLLMVCVTGTS